MLVGITAASASSGKMGSVSAFLCSAFDAEDPVFRATSWVFFWSKAWEWFDTALLVSKGKKISWLHYTHHASTGLLTSLNMVPTPNAMWGVACGTNSFVHAWMYGYYALPTFGPMRRTRVWLTRVQILQHVTVLASLFYVIYQFHAGAECHNNARPIYAAVALYGMYLAFFALFYRRAYGPTSETAKRVAP